MIKNRYYKTTVGVPFEFVVGDNLPVAGGVTAVKMSDVIASSAAGNVYLFRNEVEATGVAPYQIVVNTALATAYRKQTVFASYVTGTDAAGNYEIKNTSPMVAETITATLIAYAAPAFQESSINNAGVGTISILQELNFKIIETTPGNIPLPNWSYTQALTLGEAAAWTAIAANINLGDDSEFFTAVAAADGITITSTDATRHFKLVASILPTFADNSDTGVYYTPTYTTAAFAGNGTLSMVQELLNAGNVRRGVGHYYTQDNTTAVEFGVPLTVAEMCPAQTTFDLVVLEGFKTLPSPIPTGHNTKKHYIYIAVPPGEGAKITAIFA